MTQQVIGICGLIGSGKDTVADHLINKHNFKRISFADRLKDALCVIFGWDREMIEGLTKESRDWRNIPDEFWTAETGMTVTPRMAMQQFGTECMRNGFHTDIWKIIVKQEILNNPDTNYVISDVRFSNEIDLIRELNGNLWQVRRGELPEWWDTAISTNNLTEETAWIEHDLGRTMEERYPDIHSSEWEWVNNDQRFDHIFKNDNTIDNLINNVETELTGNIIP